MAQAQNIKSDAERMARTAGDAVADTASEWAHRASETIEDVKKGASDMADSAVERGREATRQLDAVASNMRTAVDKSVRDQPMATLAVAALAGFVLGALWKS